MIAQEQAILNVKDLRVYYWTARGAVRAVDGIDFSVKRKERFGLVGESGCGKSTTAMALLRLIKPPGAVEGGQITLDGLDVLAMGQEEVRQIRWSKLSLIPQGAMSPSFISSIFILGLLHLGRMVHHLSQGVHKLGGYVGWSVLHDPLAEVAVKGYFLCLLPLLFRLKKLVQGGRRH